MNFRLLFFSMLAWSFVGLAYIFSVYIDAIRFNTGFTLSARFLCLVVAVYSCWAVLSHSLFIVLKKPVTRAQWGYCIALFIVGLVIWQPLIAFIDVGATRVFLGPRESSIWRDLLNLHLTDIYLNSLFYTFAFLACASFIYYRHSQSIKLDRARLKQEHAEAQRDIADMKMLVLQAQLSPHFLFNCLNAISALARAGETKVLLTANARLADLLRFVVDASERALISVQEEVNFTQQYVALQTLRFGQRYHYQIKVIDVPAGAECPPFILQSLVENAYTHSFHPSLEDIQIQAKISVEGSDLLFVVSNTLPQPYKTGIEKVGLGIALENLNKRLTMLYPQKASLMQTDNADCFSVCVRIPMSDTGEAACP